MWTRFILQPMLNLLLWLYTYVGDFGLAIILFTVLVRLLLHPLLKQQTKSQEAMMRLQQDPRWKEIQEKYKNDRERLAQEQMKLYQELGVNPFGSCLPLLLQLPIIFGLYQAIMLALGNTPAQLLELVRHLYPSLHAERLLPIDSRFLWMDLAQPERLTLPFLPFGIPVLAILVGVSTYFQSKLMSQAAKPQTDTSKGTSKKTGQKKGKKQSQPDQMESMTKMMNVYMPLFLGYITMTFPAGLGLYFLVSNIVTVFQYMLLGKISLPRPAWLSRKPS